MHVDQMYRELLAAGTVERSVLWRRFVDISAATGHALGDGACHGWIDAVRGTVTGDYADLRNAYFEGRASRDQYSAGVVGLYLPVFERWASWGCLRRPWTATEVAPWVEIAATVGDTLRDGYLAGEIPLSEVCSAQHEVECDTMRALFAEQGTCGFICRPLLD